MADKPHFTAQQFIAAIPGTGGIVTAIARRVGCEWHTARRYIDRHPSVREAYDAECESVLDLAEARTIEAIKSGDGQMIRYYLSTKGKDRGYGERVDVHHEGHLTYRLLWDDGTDVADFARGPADGVG